MPLSSRCDVRCGLPDRGRSFTALLLVLSVETLRSDQEAPTDPETDDVKCLSCADVSTPFSCDEAIWCGKGEICYTRETVNHRGHQAFRLGCENKNSCEFYRHASLLFGKRNAEQTDAESEADDTPRRECYACCESTECNSGLCREALISNNLTVNHTQCQTGFIRGPKSCYYIANWTETWTQARFICRQLSSDLVSVNDQREQAFLAVQLKTYKELQSPQAFWTGGFYVSYSDEWTWFDHSAAVYQNWGPSQPYSTSYAIALVNPYGSYSGYPSWSWATIRSTYSYGFICESAYK
ncbi:uncharacterized protein LOC121379577 [Gigantopelta aegis]|uniref:uncharacterized protein LOC121379577 n=1 Tax=Gigantopelta aegis TaxID=1735272 RepID=UPI001B88CB00|nr:uncharacterized protein LOC121379577 [Gigantopelta aegis]